jgi:hypothetical protein
MAVVWMLARARLRARWRVLFGLALLGRVSEVDGFCEMFPAWDEGT